MTIEWTTRQLELGDDVSIRALHGIQSGGERGRPTLVLLHEALGCIDMWKTVPQQLAGRTGCDVFVYERRGYGGSSPIELPRPDDYLEQEGRVWLPRVLDAAGLGPVVLVGHSDGGSIALIGAAVLGEKVAGVVTMAAHIYVDVLTTAGINDAVRRYQAPGSDLPQRLARYHGERTDLLFRAWHETWTRPGYEGFDLRPWLGDILCPSLIMQGEEDHYGLPAQVEDICEGIGNRARGLMLPGCGHIPHLEAPEAALTAITDFVGSIVDDR
ncbi:alpha/beta hydrolase [Marinobacterium nitratireducens]|uniref:Alpha/beta hydrolase n=1 Tax=Marinobacterium nitratireducens TaxID=518897 RepID=A0A917ZE33_9GAMM|nr:alpha/beta hydrolase [Marinobacterium nitratireducens]GGO81321.1 alpha/beta hydrolase [Marinobacterium nitratireducens]